MPLIREEVSSFLSSPLSLTSDSHLSTTTTTMSLLHPRSTTGPSNSPDASTTILSGRLLPHDFFSMSYSQRESSSSSLLSSPYETLFSSSDIKSSLPSTLSSEFSEALFSPPSSSSSMSGSSSMSASSSSSGLTVNFAEKTLVILQDNFTSFLTSSSSSSEESSSIMNSTSLEYLNSSSPSNTTGLPDDLLSYENFLNESRFWIQRVLVPLLMVIGVIGNTITIIIMTRRRMRSSTNNYLAALATFDMLYLIFIFILSFTHHPGIHEPNFINRLYWKCWPFALMITDCCTNCSVWLTVTFTIERFIVVSHPIKGKIICTESRSRKVILLVFLICLAYVMPTPFEWIIVENKGKLHPDYSEFGRNDNYKTIYYWLTSALFVFIPLILLAVFNSFLIKSVHVSGRARSVMTQSKSQATQNAINVATAVGSGSRSPSPHPPSNQHPNVSETNGHDVSNARSVITTTGVRLESSSKQENKITIMLIAVVILFFFCQLPTAVSLIVSSIHTFPEKTKSWFISRGLNNIFNFLVAINAAGNFLLYCFFSQRYRKTFVTLFCPCYKNKLGYFQSTHPNTAVYSKQSRSAANTTSTRKTTVKSKTEAAEMTSFKCTSDQRTPVVRGSSSRTPSVKIRSTLEQQQDEETVPLNDTNNSIGNRTTEFIEITPKDRNGGFLVSSLDEM